MNDQSLGDNPTHDYIEWGKLTGCSSAWLERYVRDVEVAGSNPVIPTIFRLKPFGQQVERLSPVRDQTYAVELPVQTHDFEDSAFC